jgi:hypothetical protein
MREIVNLSNLADRINDAHKIAMEWAQCAIDRAIGVGELLTEAKVLVPHGEWEQWVTENCRFGPRQAQRYLRAFEHRDAIRAKATSDVAFESLDGALAAIAAPRETEAKRHSECRFESPPRPSAVARTQHVEPEMNGKCRLNGEPVDATPEIAAMRKAGKIPIGVVPEVTDRGEGEGETQESVAAELAERAAIQDDLSDADWLATLPLSSQLQGRQLKIFTADALLYRYSEAARRTFKKKFAELVNKQRRHGMYESRVRSFLAIKHPREWKACPLPEYDGCSATGMTPTGQCGKCHGNGYLTF